MVQSYLTTLRNRGVVINTTIANPTANALIRRNPGVVGDIDVNSSRWVASLFRRIGFVKRRKTSSKVDIPDGARKEIEFLFNHDIKEFNIPEALIPDVYDHKYLSNSTEICTS